MNLTISTNCDPAMIYPSAVVTDTITEKQVETYEKALRITTAVCQDVIQTTSGNPDLSAYHYFSNAMFTFLKYGVCWFGFRSVEEFTDIYNNISGPISIDAGDMAASDDNVPTYRLMVLSSITQRVHLSFTNDEWGDIITMVVNKLFNIYPLSQTHLNPENTTTPDEESVEGFEAAIHDTDMGLLIPREVLIKIAVQNPWLVVCALISQVSASVLIVPIRIPTEGDIHEG